MSAQLGPDPERVRAAADVGDAGERLALVLGLVAGGGDDVVRAVGQVLRAAPLELHGGAVAALDRLERDLLAVDDEVDVVDALVVGRA